MQHDTSHPALHGQTPRLAPLQFAPSNDGRLQHAHGDWEHYKPQIRQLYIEDDIPLTKVASILQDRGFHARIQTWGWTKNKPRRKAMPHRVQTSHALCPAVPSSALARLQDVLIRQMSELLLDKSELEFWTWGPGPYGDSPSFLSLADIIQGNLLVRRQHVAEGFCLIQKGFSNVGQVFQTHTLCAILDMVVHLHRYCDAPIIRMLLKHLVSLSEQRTDRGRRVQDSLNELLGLSTNPSLSYRDSLLEAQYHIYNEFRRQGALQEPSLLATMAAGVAPHLSEPPWAGTDWKEFLVSSLDQMRGSLRDRYGIHHPSYHSWLWRHLGRIRNICGEDSEAAFELAACIRQELGSVTPQETRLLPECWLTMAQYHWKELWQQAECDMGSPRAQYAIHLLCKYTNSREASGAANDAELGWLRVLEDWQVQAGSSEEAANTSARCNTMIREIGAIRVGAS
ncbi:uncharacterized protein PG986_005632 [Apiospora aurea]|uniref:Clr5 domain-containing protein n=1 Tax=Apiospora aurea TaxID=335848 RepID=A0ABR1QIC4_9PEZI